MRWERLYVRGLTRRGSRIASPSFAGALAWRLLFAGWAASRIAYWRAGLRFDARPLGFYLQYVDPELLRERLLESVYHLHGQPPAFNLFLGLVLQAFPTDTHLAYHAFFLAVGLALTAVLFATLKRLGVTQWLALVLALLFTASPTTVLFEHWLFYEYPTALFLVAAAYFLHRFCCHARLRHGLAFFSFAALVALTRGIFHLAWFAALFVLVLLVQRGRWKRVLAAAAAPGALLLALYVKNLVVFGTFGTGDVYAKLNLAEMTTFRLPAKVRAELVKREALSRLALVPFGRVKEPRRFRPYVRDVAPTGVPVLDDFTKSTRYVNWHSMAFLRVADVYFEDAKYVLRTHPETYFAAVKENAVRYLRPSSETYPFLRRKGYPNYRHIKTFVRRCDEIVCGQPRFEEPGWLLAGGFPLLVASGLALAVRALRRGRRAYGATLLFLCFNVLWVSAIGILCSYGDQNRYRFLVNGLYVTLLGAVVTATFDAARRWRWRRRSAQ